MLNNIYYILPFVALSYLLRKRLYLLYLFTKVKIDSYMGCFSFLQKIKEYLKIPYVQKLSHKDYEFVFFDDDGKYIVPIHRNDTLSVYDILDDNENSLSEDYIHHLRFLEKYKIRPLESLPNVKFLVKVI